MTKDEALKLALEALELIGMKNWSLREDKAITAIKEALMSGTDGAQPEQEPVAWRAWVSKFPQGTGSDWVYVTNPIMKDRIHNQPLYTTPPQRKPLTEQEIGSCIDEVNLTSQYGHHHFGWHKQFARAIEAAHGIKGEA